MRMFIGVALSRAARRHIARTVEPVRASLGKGVVPPENLHITLDFLGEVQNDRIDAVKGAMQQAVAGSAPVLVMTADTGRFGRDLLYLGVGKGADRLATIKEKLDAELAGASVTFDRKPFRPHITLARRAGGGQDLKIPAISFTAGGLTLFKSERTRFGQVYTPVAEAAFPEGRLRIDRIEGDLVVCENSGGAKIDVPVCDLPFQPAEGMLINKDGTSYTILEPGGAQRLSARKSVERL